MNNPKRFLSQILPFFLLAFFILVGSSCGDEEPGKPLSVSKSIVSFVIDGYETTIHETGRTIVIRVPAQADVSQLTPIITVSEGATVSPVSGVAQDFSDPVIYTVTAENNTTQKYTVSVEFYFGLQEFNIKASTYYVRPGIIDHTKKEVIVDVSFWDLRSFANAGAPIITESSVLENYTISPPPGLAVDVTPDPIIDVVNPPEHTVTGPGETAIQYKIRIRNTDSDLRGFRLNIPGVDESLLLNQMESTVRPLVLTTDDLSALTVNVRMSERATLSPSADTPMNFNQDVIYSVISEAGTKSNTTIRVDKRLVIFTNEHLPNIVKNIFVLNHQGIINYRAISNIVGARLLHPETSDVVACTVENEVLEGQMSLKINPASPFDGKYQLEVTLATGEVILTAYHMEY